MEIIVQIALFFYFLIFFFCQSNKKTSRARAGHLTGKAITQGCGENRHFSLLKTSSKWQINTGINKMARDLA